MREKIDLGSDVTLLIAQLKRLAASRLGRKLQLNELVFVSSELAQAIIDIDSAVRTYGDKELREEWEGLKKRVIRKAALEGVKQLSESTKIFIAGAGESKSKHGDDEWEE